MGLTLKELVATYQVATVGSAFLGEEQLMAALKEAVESYCAYQVLGIQASDASEPGYDPSGQPINPETELTLSELEVIRPLWELLNEREIARMMEMSRGQGVEPAMRSSAEVEMAILEYRARLPGLAFYEPVRSI